VKKFVYAFWLTVKEFELRFDVLRVRASKRKCGLRFDYRSILMNM
jgi:hypothetical protein